MDALIYAAKASRLPYQLPAGPEVTDIILSSDVISTSTLLTVTAIADDSRYGTRTFGADEPTQAISTARITIDQPAWITSTQAYHMTAGDNFDSGTATSTVSSVVGTLDTSGWEPGRYTVFVEAQDDDGNWGVPTAASFAIAREEYEAALRSESDSTTTVVGDNVNYSLTLSNYGWSSDLYSLTITSTFEVDLAQSTIVISAGQSALIELSVNVPTTLTTDLLQANLISDTLTLSVESQGAGQEVQRFQLTTAVAPYRRYFPFYMLP